MIILGLITAPTSCGPLLSKYLLDREGDRAVSKENPFSRAYILVEEDRQQK
jgi:hypothetical protein